MLFGLVVLKNSLSDLYHNLAKKQTATAFHFIGILAFVSAGNNECIFSFGADPETVVNPFSYYPGDIIT